MEMQQQIHDLVTKSETILDVGARFILSEKIDGYHKCHALVYSDINPQANIYCFEPDLAFFSILQEKVSESGAKNITYGEFFL